jgi:hypothetical protein
LSKGRECGRNAAFFADYLTDKSKMRYNMVNNNRFFAGLPKYSEQNVDCEKCKGYLRTILYRLKADTHLADDNDKSILSTDILKFHRNLCHGDYAEAYFILLWLGGRFDFSCKTAKKLLIETLSAFLED